MRGQMLRVAEQPSRADLQAFGSRIGSVASLDDLRPELAGVPAAPKADAGMALGVLVIANSELVLAAVARALQQAQLGAIVLHATSEPQLLPSLAAIRKGQQPLHIVLLQADLAASLAVPMQQLGLPVVLLGASKQLADLVPCDAALAGPTSEVPLRHEELTEVLQICRQRAIGVTAAAPAPTPAFTTVTQQQPQPLALAQAQVELLRLQLLQLQKHSSSGSDPQSISAAAVEQQAPGQAAAASSMLDAVRAAAGEQLWAALQLEQQTRGARAATYAKPRSSEELLQHEVQWLLQQQQPEAGQPSAQGGASQAAPPPAPSSAGAAQAAPPMPGAPVTLQVLAQQLQELKQLRAASASAVLVHYSPVVPGAGQQAPHVHGSADAVAPVPRSMEEMLAGHVARVGEPCLLDKNVDSDDVVQAGEHGSAVSAPPGEVLDFERVGSMQSLLDLPAMPEDIHETPASQPRSMVSQLGGEGLLVNGDTMGGLEAGDGGSDLQDVELLDMNEQLQLLREHLKTSITSPESQPDHLTLGAAADEMPGQAIVLRSEPLHGQAVMEEREDSLFSMQEQVGTGDEGTAAEGDVDAAAPDADGLFLSLAVQEEPKSEAETGALAEAQPEVDAEAKTEVEAEHSYLVAGIAVLEPEAEVVDVAEQTQVWVDKQAAEVQEDAQANRAGAKGQPVLTVAGAADAAINGSSTSSLSTSRSSSAPSLHESATDTMPDSSEASEGDVQGMLRNNCSLEPSSGDDDQGAPDSRAAVQLQGGVVGVGCDAPTCLVALALAAQELERAALLPGGHSNTAFKAALRQLEAAAQRVEAAERTAGPANAEVQAHLVEAGGAEGSCMAAAGSSVARVLSAAKEDTCEGGQESPVATAAAPNLVVCAGLLEVDAGEQCADDVPAMHSMADQSDRESSAGTGLISSIAVPGSAEQHSLEQRNAVQEALEDFHDTVARLRAALDKQHTAFAPSEVHSGSQQAVTNGFRDRMRCMQQQAEATGRRATRTSLDSHPVYISAEDFHLT